MQPHNKYNPEIHPQLYLDLMREGKTIYHFLAKVGIVLDTAYRWAENYPEFGDAMDQGEALAYNWWLQYGLENSENDDWDNTVWKHTMNTRFRVFTQGVYLRNFTQIERAIDKCKYIIDAAANKQLLTKDGKGFTDLIEASERVRQFSDQEERLAKLEAQIAQSQKI